MFVLVSICVTAQNIGDNIKAKSIAKMRADTEPISTIIATINKDDVVKILSIEKNGYYYVDYNGTKGYVNEVYFKVDSLGLLSEKNVIKNNSTEKKEPVKEMKKYGKIIPYICIMSIKGYLLL